MNDSMTNQNIHLEIEIDSNLYDKLCYICEYYKHALDIQLPCAIQQYVIEFERVHGNIKNDNNKNDKG